MTKDSINLISIPMRYRGRMDIEALFQAANKWMTVRRMIFGNSFYKDKVCGPGITEKEIRFEGMFRYDEFQRWLSKIEMTFWDCKAEAVNGKTVFMGRCEIRISGTIDTDYRNTYTKSPFLIKIGYMLQHMLKRQNEEILKKECEATMYEFLNDCRSILGMESTQ